MLPRSIAPVILAATLAAIPIPAAAKPAEPPNLFDNFAIPTLQLVGAEALVAGFLLLNNKWDNDATVALLFAMPAAVAYSTCLIGTASQRYRGSCVHSWSGMLVGIASGLLVYGLLEAVPSLNPFERSNQDETQTFVNQVGAVVYIVLIGIPVGSVVGWNVGKTSIGKTSIDDPRPPAPPPLALDGFRRHAPPRFMVPLLSFRF